MKEVKKVDLEFENEQDRLDYELVQAQLDAAIARAELKEVRETQLRRIRVLERENDRLKAELAQLKYARKG